MSAMGNAFRAVGFRTARERLRDETVRAFFSHEPERALFKAIKNDPGLLLELFEPYRVMALERQMREVQKEMRDEARAEGSYMPVSLTRNEVAGAALVAPVRTGGDRLAIESQLDSAPTSQSDGRRSPAAVPGAGQRNGDNQTECARPLSFPKPSAPPRDRLREAGRVAEVIRTSPRLQMKITLQGSGGAMVEILLGEATANQALTWARGQHTNAIFVRKLALNLPPNAVIGEWHDANSSDAIWKEALKEASLAA